jgi:hypothetical protein
LERIAALGGENAGGYVILNTQRLKRGLLLPARGIRALQESRRIGVLGRVHLSSTAPIVSSEGPVVSLTSYGRRIETVHLAIESIADGKVLPSRLILWLDQEETFRNLPESLLRLKRRGLEVRLAKSYGPHTKYYPYLENCRGFNVPLVTADDDILYPTYWLEGLARAYVERSDLINCYRARVIALHETALAPYEGWRMCHTTVPDIRHLATGVSGVIYPPEYLDVLKRAGPEFNGCCPKADDLWLHVQALRSGYRVRQFVKHFKEFPMIPGTQQIALQNYNRGLQDAGNDRQAAVTYTQQDIQILTRAVNKRTQGNDARVDQQRIQGGAH